MNEDNLFPPGTASQTNYTPFFDKQIRMIYKSFLKCPHRLKVFLDIFNWGSIHFFNAPSLSWCRTIDM